MVYSFFRQVKWLQLDKSINLVHNIDAFTFLADVRTHHSNCEKYLWKKLSASKKIGDLETPPECFFFKTPTFTARNVLVMRTLQLTVSETAYEKLKVIFSLFGKKDLVVEQDDYEEHKKFLHEELVQIKNGTIELIDLKEAEQQLDAFIARL